MEEPNKWTPAEFATDFVAGLIGGSAGLIVGHPFDTVKVIFQTSKIGLGIPECSRMIISQEGARGFYKGMAYPLASVGFLNSVFFGCNSIIYQKIRGLTGSKNADVFIAGAVAGGIQSIPGTPIELTKVRLQAQLDNKGAQIIRHRYTGPWDCLSHTFREHGIRGCYRGVTATLARDISGFSVYIAVYKWLCDLGTTNRQTGPHFTFMLWAGGMAGVISWIANYPTDTIKSIMQSDSLTNPAYRNSWHCIKTVVRQEGFRVLYKGMGPAVVRAFPLNAVTLAVYDWTERRMQYIIKRDD